MEKYDFTCDWFTDRVEPYKHHLDDLYKKVRSEKGYDFDYLEIGTYEGRSALWFADNFPVSNITCVDPYNLYHDLPLQLLTDAKRRFLKNKAGRDNITHFETPFHKFAMEDNNAFYQVIYVDGSHLSFDVYTDAVLAWEILDDGGIMILDDYELVNYPEHHENCKMGIDYFLKRIEGKYELLFKGWQVVIKKL